jgi:hypothetical protein
MSHCIDDYSSDAFEKGWSETQMMEAAHVASAIRGRVLHMQTFLDSIELAVQKQLNVPLEDENNILTP